MFPTFKEFFFENRKGERNPHHTNIFKGFDGKTKGFNMTYQVNKSENEFEQSLKNLRSGAASFLVVTPHMKNYLVKKYHQHNFPTEVNQKVALGRSGNNTNQIFLSLNNTGHYILTTH
jgi:hypothetical protein